MTANMARPTDPRKWLPGHAGAVSRPPDSASHHEPERTLTKKVIGDKVFRPETLGAEKQ
jgi:hypothetical protein